MKKLEFLIIHCTATPEGRSVTASEIKDWHLSPRKENGKFFYMGKVYNNVLELPEQVRYKRGRGWKQVGYSDMILLGGQEINLVKYNDDDVVDSWEVTNGAEGVNFKSRHIVYVGGCDDKMNPKDTRTEAQTKAMEVYIKSFLVNHPTARVAGHNQFAAKKCPSFDVPKWLASIGVKQQNIYLPV